MAFLRLAFFPGGTAEQWAAALQAIGDIPPPEGRRALAAGPVDDGWQVMQLWDSREDLEGFNRATFFPASADLSGHGFTQAPAVRDIDTASDWIGEQQI